VYTSSSGCVVATGLDNVPETVCNSSLDADGKDLARQPLFQTRITPAYSVPSAWENLRFWTTVEYIGRHFGEMYEKQYLGSYYDLSFGVTGVVGRHWEWTVRGNQHDQPDRSHRRQCPRYRLVDYRDQCHSGAIDSGPRSQCPVEIRIMRVRVRKSQNPCLSRFTPRARGTTNS
jgi:hypothetical protein